jgi:hypothetical protein
MVSPALPTVMNTIEKQERRNESRELPVDWDRLKQIQDEHPTPRVSGVMIVAIGLVGLSAFSFFLRLRKCSFVSSFRHSLFGFPSDFEICDFGFGCGSAAP